VKLVLPLLACLLLLVGCNPTPCETNLDCLIECQCEGAPASLFVGPYECSGGTCSEAHRRDRDCERPCEDATFRPQVTAPDDDDADDDDSGLPGDDDDSGLPGDDDDSGLPGDDDDSGR